MPLARGHLASFHGGVEIQSLIKIICTKLALMGIRQIQGGQAYLLATCGPYMQIPKSMDWGHVNVKQVFHQTFFLGGGLPRFEEKAEMLKFPPIFPHFF